MPTRFSKLAKILPPGMYAKLFEKELAEKAAQEAAAWKPGELYRTVSEPKITDINPEFRDTYIENLKREAAAKPTPENQQRLQTAIDDLLPKLESAPKSPEELAAARRLEEFASESKPKVLTREQMGQKRELDKIIEEINADKSSAEKTKLMEPSSEASTKILPVLGLTGAAALASSLDPDEAEAGVKGSLAPRKELADKFKKTINNWVIGGTNDQRNILSNMLDEDQTGLVRKEMLRRLSKEGKIQFNPEFNEHSIRLYRGDNEDFFNKGLYKTQSTSWTPDLGVANFFREGAGNTYQTDLPISKIGAYLNSLPGERAFRKEKEVIVKPFEGKVEKKSIFDDDDNSASNLLELINKRINQETPISDLTEKTYGIRSDVAKKKELAKDYAKLTNQGHKFLNKNIPNITKDLSNEDVLNFIQKTGFSTNLLENLANLPYHQSDYLSPEHKAFLKEKASEIQTPSDFILNNIAKKKQLDDPAQKNTEKMRLVNQIDNLYYSGVINKDEYKSLQNKTITEFRGNEYGDLNDMVNTYKTYLENFKNEGTDKLEPYFRKQSLENYLENMYVDRVITKDEHDILKDVLNKHFNEFNKEEPSSPYFSPELLGIAGAGALASSSSAEAADAIPISRSNPEYTSSATSKNVKQAAAEEQDKSNVIKSLEGLGVYGRSLFDSGTLGISDVGVSSVAGLLNALATSNEQAPFSERFKRGYAEDKAYYEKIKKEHPLAELTGSLAGYALPTKYGGLAAGAFGGFEKGLESIPLVSKIEGMSGLGGVASRIGVRSGADAAAMGAINPIERKIKETERGLVGLPETQDDWNAKQDLISGGVLGGGLQTIGEIGRAFGGKRGEELAKGATSLGLFGLGGYAAANEKEETPVKDNLTQEQIDAQNWEKIKDRLSKNASEM